MPYSVAQTIRDSGRRTYIIVRLYGRRDFPPNYQRTFREARCAQSTARSRSPSARGVIINSILRVSENSKYVPSIYFIALQAFSARRAPTTSKTPLTFHEGRSWFSSSDEKLLYLLRIISVSTLFSPTFMFTRN